jgi:RHS repeat-associated protein
MMSRLYTLVSVFLLTCSLPVLSSSNAIAVTTTSEVVGEDVVWSISGVSNIHYDSRINLGSTEIVYYTASMRKGSTPTVYVDIPDARELVSGITAQRKLLVSIPDAGIRWVAEKAWNSSDGPSPTSVTLDHQARYSPYQADPAYPDSRHQPDKYIQIMDVTMTYEEGTKYLIIYIMPNVMVGMGSPEYNGLPKYARTEPDYQRKKPKGCNGCSPMGLPGHRVNMATLKPVIQDTLYQWSGRGPAVELAITWNGGLPPGTTNFGEGWRFSYDAWLKESSDGVTVYMGGGEQLHFTVPVQFNASVTGVTATAQDTEVKLDYSGPAGEPAYAPDWDGWFEAEVSGYRLQKTVDGEPGLRTFRLTPPDSRLVYLFQGSDANYYALPLIAVEDWNGNRLTVTRNGSGAITAVTDAVGRQALLTYNGSGQCTALTVPGGHQVTFAYSGTNLVNVTDLIGNQTDYEHSGTHMVTNMDTGGRSWQFGWITEADLEYLSSVTDPEGQTTFYELLVPDFAYRRLRITDPSGRDFIYDFPNGQYEGNSRQQAPSVESDALGRPVIIQQKGSSQTRQLEYNSEGDISRVNEYDGGVHTYSYNSLGLVTNYVDALGGTWLFEYDDSGNLTRSQSPEGRVFEYEYNAFGELVQATDGEGNITTASYDGFGNVRTVTDPEGSVTTYGYDGNGINLVSHTAPSGNTTTFSYDENRRMVRMTHPDGSYLENIYDCCAAVGLRNENGAVRTVTRSPSLKVLSETDFLGNTMTYTYDEEGRLVQSRDARGRTTDTTYNEQGMPAAISNPLGQEVRFDYYSNTDQLFLHTLSQEPLAQAEISMSWRGVASKANGWEFVRDKMGRLMRIITPRDYWKRINFTRDADGLLIGKDWNETETLAAYERDGNGRIVSAGHPLGTDSYTRNGRGQVTGQTWYDGQSVSFTYDAAGRLSTMVYPDLSTAAYSYDVRGRISSISWKGEVINTSYDSAGNLTGEIRSNGISTQVVNDANSLPLQVRHYSGTKDMFNLQCTRNSGGLISSCTQSSDAFVLFPELAPETVSSTFTYNRSFTMVTRNGEAATTDSNGNQLTVPGPRSFSGTYDYRNLLTSWSASGISHTAVYDGMNRLIQWTQNGTVRRYHYDEMDRLLFETDGSGNLTAMWLYRGSQVVAMAEAGGDILFYHTDLRGNIAFLSNESGSVTATYRYLPFGLNRASGYTVRNPFTFVGAFGVIDLGEGLYYMRSRTYDAVSRAFLSNDPMGLGVTVNAREYARNNPVNWVDPDGRFGFLTQYSAEGAVAPRTGPDFDNKIYNTPTMTYEPPKGGSSDPCAISTAWNVATSNKQYGNAAGAAQVLMQLYNGEYGDAFYNAAGVAAGMVSRVAGMLPAFMAANPAGEANDEAERALIEKLMNDPNSFYNKNKEKYPSKYNNPKPDPYEFTLPPFSLDE